MFEHEDGSVTGSIDHTRLAEVKPKSDEAKAQHEALKAEAEAGNKQAAADAERLAEQARAQDPTAGSDDDERQRQADREQEDAKQQQAAVDAKQPDQGDDVKALQAEAEASGVTVDKRWGADRLRQEIDAAKSATRKRG